MQANFTNEQLFDLVKQGNEKAFSLFYERYWEQLLAQAHFMLKSLEEAEEVVHDTFVEVWNRRASIEIKYTIGTYLAAINRYTCLKYLAKRKKSSFLETSANLPEINDSSTQQWLDFEALRHELEFAIEQLPDKCQIIFKYSRELGLADKEIAHKMNISVNTVRTQMHRALRKLKTGLQHIFF